MLHAHTTRLTAVDRPLGELPSAPAHLRHGGRCRDGAHAFRPPDDIGFGPAATRLVATTGTDAGTCLVTPCKTINFAIGQAASGDTVSVAAGSYAEAVVINKDITLQGAKQGVSATTGRTDATQESTIAAPGGNDISYAAPAVTGTVDGFTLGGSGVGIFAVNGGSGLHLAEQHHRCDRHRHQLHGRRHRPHRHLEQPDQER